MISPGNPATSSPRRFVIRSPSPQRNKPRLVLLNIEDYERLMKQSDRRSVGTIGTMSDELFAEFENAVETYAGEDEAGR